MHRAVHLNPAVPLEVESGGALVAHHLANLAYLVKMEASERYSVE